MNQNNYTAYLQQKEIIDSLSSELKIIITKEDDFQPLKECYFIKSDINIISLVLKNANISNLPLQLFKLKELILLNLSKNILDNLPNEICTLEKLTILDLSNNNFTNLPDCLSKLEFLKELKLNNNQFYTIPKAIIQMKNLRRIFIHNNQIKSLPFELTDLVLLEELHIDFRSTMSKISLGIIAQLEIQGCRIFNQYNRR